MNELLPKGVAESQSYEKPKFAVMKRTKMIQVAFQKLFYIANLFSSRDAGLINRWS